MNISNPVNSEENDKITPECAPIALQPPLQQDHEDRSIERSSQSGHDPPPRINPRDYKPLEVPDHTFYRACGSPWTHHVEKLTPERKARPKEERRARRICRECFESAKAHEPASCRMLPGTLDLARMELLKATVGRCSLCDLERAVYRDASTGVLLCESCYQREVSR